MIRFEWDLIKARTNVRKHGISFEIAQHVFDDPFAFVEQDRIEGGELRWQTIGTVGEVLVLLVAHSVEVDEDEPGETIRIISARRANRKERSRYEKERRKSYS
jgi:uncharacterized DUF497 family protein